jgi:hypothetical protein
MPKNFSPIHTFKKSAVFASVLALGASAAFFSTNATRADAAPTVYSAGTVADYHVPDGATQLAFTVIGAAGEDGSGTCGGQGGAGAIVTGIVDVVDTDIIQVQVADPVGEGTLGGVGNQGGGTGGDASAMYLNGMSYSNRIAVAGGGGGGGASNGFEGSCVDGVYGGDGGGHVVDQYDGQDGTDGGDGENTSYAGEAGTSSAGGLGGANDDYNAEGQPGGEEVGGDGGYYLTGSPNSNTGGGGGGGGAWAGGGGVGGYYAGAGGGSGASFIDSDIVSEDSVGPASEGPSISIEVVEDEESTTTPTTTESTTETTQPGETTSTTAPSTQVPNNGDANGDGQVDADQDNVVTFQNDATKNGETQWASFEFTDACEKTALSMKKEESFTAQDVSYDYPVGLMNFTLECSQPTITVSQYLYGLTENASSFVARKYLSYNNTYVTLEGASVTDVTIGGNHVIKLTYSLTDGGKYDNDQTVNGTIVDPAGIALAPGALATTGSNIASTLFWSIAFVFVGGALALGMLFARRRKIALLTGR